MRNTRGDSGEMPTRGYNDFMMIIQIEEITPNR